MADVLANNPIALRGCILYKFIKGKEPFETYKKMMEMFGDDFMTYPEFEFWYMRFAQGNFDLDYDFSLEPKKRQITDLPVDLFEKVGDYLYFEDRNHLRNVSKDIQFLVNNWNPNITQFTFYSVGWWTIEQNWTQYEYYQRANEYFQETPKHLSIVARMLKNPKLRLKKLTVYPDKEWTKIEQELRESSTKLHVNKFALVYPKDPIDIGLFAPKSLEEVTIVINETSVLNEFVNSEQCKRLKMLTIETLISPSKFPFESFIGFPRFTIRFPERHTDGKVDKFIKKFINSTQLELCRLESAYCVDWPTWESIGEDLRQRCTLVPDCPNVRRYPIQGSTDFYEINIIEKTSISIERKS